MGDSHEKEISSIASALGVNLSSPCNFSVETLFKAAPDAVDEALEQKFQEYFKLLVERKYFANCEEGSEEYAKRANTARERFFAKFQKPADPIQAMTKEQRAEEAEKHKNRANELLKERKWQEAVDEYTTALKYAENAVIYANRAVPYGKLNKFQEAIADCKKAIVLDAAYIKGHMRLGYMYFQLKDYANAVLAYKAGLVHEPTNEALQNDLAKAQSFCTPTATNSNAGGMGGMGGGPGLAGMPDMSQFAAMMGGAGGGGAGMPNFMEMMGDPQFMQAAQQFMLGNPQLMQWAQNLSQNPEVVQQIMQGRIPEGMPMPDVTPENIEEMVNRMPPNLMQSFANLPAFQGLKKEEKKDDDAMGGM